MKSKFKINDWLMFEIENTDATPENYALVRQVKTVQITNDYDDGATVDYYFWDFDDNISEKEIKCKMAKVKQTKEK